MSDVTGQVPPHPVCLQAREDSSSGRWRRETGALMSGAGKEHPKQVGAPKNGTQIYLADPGINNQRCNLLTN